MWGAKRPQIMSFWDFWHLKLISTKTNANGITEINNQKSFFEDLTSYLSGKITYDSKARITRVPLYYHSPTRRLLRSVVFREQYRFVQIISIPVLLGHWYTSATPQNVSFYRQPPRLVCHALAMEIKEDNYYLYGTAMCVKQPYLNARIICWGCRSMANAHFAKRSCTISIRVF